MSDTDKQLIAILREMVALDELDCPTILVNVQGEEPDENSSNCPLAGKGECLCAGLHRERFIVNGSDSSSR